MRQFWFDLRWIVASIATWAENLGYLVRPYDMLADRRRWFWQPRQPCARSPEALAIGRQIAGTVEHVDVDIPGIGRVVGVVDRDTRYRIDLAAGGAPVPNQYTELFANDPAILCGYPAPIDDRCIFDEHRQPLLCTRQAGHETVGDHPDRLNHRNTARQGWIWRTRRGRS